MTCQHCGHPTAPPERPRIKCTGTLYQPDCIPCPASVVYTPGLGWYINGQSYPDDALWIEPTSIMHRVHRWQVFWDCPQVARRRRLADRVRTAFGFSLCHNDDYVLFMAKGSLTLACIDVNMAVEDLCAPVVQQLERVCEWLGRRLK